MNPSSPRCRRIQLGLAGALLAASSLAVHAQTQDPLTLSPRGLTDVPSTTTTSVPTPAPVQVTPGVGVPFRAGSGVPTGLPLPGSAALPAGVAPPAASAPPQALPLPPNPATSLLPVVFGSQMFSGRFAANASTGFDPDYQIAVGDRVVLRLWGAVTYEAVQIVDAQGNIFVPSVGPIAVKGVRNGDLNPRVEQQVKRVFRANVGVYATLEAAQPVKVFVTGFVRAPGMYGGLSSDSVLAYLDRAGGIDPDRGSYLDVTVLRGGKPRATVNLYSFLLDGQIAPLQLQDGDAIVAAPRRHAALVTGQVLNPYIFEFGKPRIPATELLALARPRPDATHMSIVRKIGAERRSEYFALVDAPSVMIEDGDEVTFTSDKYPGTILVHVEGAHRGQRTLVLPYGTSLGSVLAQVQPTRTANMTAVQLFRLSVAQRQKERLDDALRSLETYALTARSATSEESALRAKEADLILQFIERAKTVQPKGQVLLAGAAEVPQVQLEDGDLIQIPELSHLVLVSGEVTFPNALVWEDGSNAADYVKRAGGYTQDADKSKLIVLHQDGSIAAGGDVALLPGDEVLVLPAVQSKNIEVTRGITQIIYQIAVAAKVAFGL